jgi:hypothetical protein
MALELNELKKLHDKAYDSNHVTRENAANDLVFYYVTHWDDAMISTTQLSYRGQFDVLKKAGRQIISDLASNPIQVDFEPKDEDREDAGDVADGLYRADDNTNQSIESYEVGKQEAVVCGFGAWEMYHEYVTMRNGDKNQVIKRRPIMEANNTVFFDPNAQLLDKSDAKYCSVLRAYSEDGYRNLVIELTGEDPGEVTQESFKFPEQSFTFPWVGGEGPKIYVVSFYHMEKVKDKILTMSNPFGESMELKESDLKDVMDDMIDTGFEIEGDPKPIERWQCTKYIASGKEILASSVVAGEHIPIIPVYGERGYIEGELHYEGVTRLAKDPQRLRDFQLSYVADIVARSPRQKPIFWQEQIAGFEAMYSETGADNNYPYLLQNRTTLDGSDLPIGPVGVMPEQKLPQPLIDAIPLAREAIEDVANPGIPQDVADPDTSGKAVLAMQNRLDMQSMIYQEHYKHAKRHDGVVWASMASEIYDVPRRVKTELPDGTRQNVQIMESVIDEETGDIVMLNDMRNVEFDVYSKISTSYSSQKEQTIERLSTVLQSIAPEDPMKKVIMLKLLKLMDGVDFDDVRDYANKQLLLMGIREPETDEEKQMLAQQQSQAQEPDAAMVLAQAEMLKGQADMLREKREGIKMQLEAQNKDKEIKVKAFSAQTDRIDTQIDAQEAGANISMKRIEALGKQLDNKAKIIQLEDYQNMDDDELFQSILNG